MTKLTDLLHAHWNDEGWHRIYKKYGGAVLAKENYRWKRKIRRRFGECRKCAFRAELMRDPANTVMGRIAMQRLAEALDQPLLFTKTSNWKGGTIPFHFGSKP